MVSAANKPKAHRFGWASGESVVFLERRVGIEPTHACLPDRFSTFRQVPYHLANDAQLQNHHSI
jgi:hypothetical protein